MQKKILIVEDDEAIIDAVSLVLQYAGYIVLVVRDGKNIMDLMHEAPDLILLDIIMQGKNGVEICKELKQSEKFKHIPVVMVSAKQDLENYALNAGADDYIEKPFGINTLLNKVAKNIK